MNNILYLDDYINLYLKQENILIVTKAYKKTLKNGKIIDSEKFIKKFLMLLEKYKLKNKIFRESILIIVNQLYEKDDIFKIKKILEEFNFTNIKIKKEIDFLKICKYMLVIGFNYSYFYIYYTDKLGNIEKLVYENNKLNRDCLLTIINALNKKEIYIFGKNIYELINIIDNRLNYYYYEDFENLFIKKIIDDKKV